MQLIGALIVLVAAVPSAGWGCDIAINTPGVLKLAGDGKSLSSTLAGGAASVLAISDFNLLSPTTVTISNVRLDVTPAGFAEPVTYQAAYQATWLLNTRNGTLVSNPSFTVPAALNVAVVVVLDNTVTSLTGFKQGNYTTKTTVTCS
jgi:hypothetical protein